VLCLLLHLLLHLCTRHEQLKKLSLAHNVIRIIPDLRENPLLARVLLPILSRMCLMHSIGRDNVLLRLNAPWPIAHSP
jgi:hypothetical protein